MAVHNVVLPSDTVQCICKEVVVFYKRFSREKQVLAASRLAAVYSVTWCDVPCSPYTPPIINIDSRQTDRQSSGPVMPAQQLAGTMRPVSNRRSSVGRRVASSKL